MDHRKLEFHPRFLRAVVLLDNVTFCDWYATPEIVTRMCDWPETLEIPKQKVTSETRIAVIPNAAMQYYRQ